MSKRDLDHVHILNPDGSHVSPTNPLPMSMGSGGLQQSAWGEPLFVHPISLFHGLWTFDVPRSMWMVEEDGSEVAPDSVTSCTSSGGALSIASSGFTTVHIHSRRHPRYQPNRGHKYSTAMVLPSLNAASVRDFGLFTADSGVFFRLSGTGSAYTLYAVRRTGGVDTAEEITLPSSLSSLDLTKGNVFDIQFQWRGVGNYKFFINLVEVHSMDLLGTLTGLSIENPALPAAFEIDNTGGGNASMLSGCVDITSEGGTEDRIQHQSISNEISTGGTGEVPVLSIMSPALIGTKVNSRDARLLRISGSAEARMDFTLYKTRDLAALTGESFAAVAGTGSFMEVDTTASAIVGANATEILSFKVQANDTDSRDNPDKDRLDFFITHGDILILTAQGANTTVKGTIEWGEEI